jgi:hypothetical protein
MKAAEPLPGGDGPYLRGELEDRRAADTRARGTIRYPPSVAVELLTMSRSLGIEAPAEFGRLP